MSTFFEIQGDVFIPKKAVDYFNKCFEDWLEGDEGIEEDPEDSGSRFRFYGMFRNLGRYLAEILTRIQHEMADQGNGVDGSVAIYSSDGCLAFDYFVFDGSNNLVVMRTIDDAPRWLVTAQPNPRAKEGDDEIFKYVMKKVDCLGS